MPEEKKPEKFVPPTPKLKPGASIVVKDGNPWAKMTGTLDTFQQYGPKSENLYGWHVIGDNGIGFYVAEAELEAAAPVKKKAKTK